MATQTDICTVCNKRVYPVEMVRSGVENRCYHRGCFHCHHCGTALTVSNFSESQGNVYCTGAEGVWVFNPKGEHLGTIVTPELPANCCWGSGFRGLYITARTSVYHVRTKVAGTRTF